MRFLDTNVLVSLISLWCFTSFAFTEEMNYVTETPSPALAPSPYNHGHHHPRPLHHHHHHLHPHPHSPAKSPVKPHVSPPAKPPVKPSVYPPTKAPVKPPTKAPVKPPVSPPAKAPLSSPEKSPVKPPVYPPKFNMSLIAVEGTVFCKSCRHSSSKSLYGAKPIKGAVVKLWCKSKKNIEVETRTDKNGYFLLFGPKTVANYRKCRVYLVKSKDYKCNKISKLFGGDVGAVLKPEKRRGKSAVVINKRIYNIFNVGPFAFDSVCPKRRG